ncbi:MAG: hypothetical protein JXA19_03785 [Anaerolineales bacterium]|nr:hypothetical protein [Anaerolineales bacterium]
MDFGKILSKAWNTIWKHKWLWLFGVLAGCGANGGSGGNSGSSGSSNFNPSSSSDFERQLSEFGNQFTYFVEDNVALLIGIAVGFICFMFLLSIVMYLVSIVGKTGMIKGTLLADEVEGTLTFGQIFEGVKEYFLRFLLLDFVLTFGVGLVVFLIMVPLILLGILTMGILLLCIIPFICILIPIMLLFNIYVMMAEVALIAEDLSFGEALQKGWLVFKENIINLILMGLILGVGGFIVGLIISLPAIIVLVPAFGSIIFGAVQDSMGFVWGGVGFLVIALICLTPIMIFLRGVMTSFVLAAWTYTYKEVEGSSPIAMNEVDEYYELGEG